MYPTNRLHQSNALVFTIGRPRTTGLDTAGELPDCPEDYGVAVPGMDGSDMNVQGTDLAGSVLLDNSLSRMFVAAYLFTGSAQQAEAAIIQSIQELEVTATRNGRLSWKAFTGALLRYDPDAARMPDEAPAMLLPVELRRVLRLSHRLRQCFVLRVLMAMPCRYCAGLLRIDAEQVAAYSRLAARELAEMAAAEAAN
jgi:hypothetical protein